MSDNKFILTENKFLEQGICKYIDKYGNTAMIKRTGDTDFTAKIRFANKGVKAGRIVVKVEDIANGKAGENLHLEFANKESIEKEDITESITAFTALIQHWIDIFLDLRFSFCKNEDKLLLANPGASVNDVYSYKLELLSQYEEMQPFFESFMKEGN